MVCGVIAPRPRVLLVPDMASCLKTSFSMNGRMSLKCSFS